MTGTQKTTGKNEALSLKEKQVMILKIWEPASPFRSPPISTKNSFLLVKFRNIRTPAEGSSYVKQTKKYFNRFATLKCHDILIF